MSATRAWKHFLRSWRFQTAAQITTFGVLVGSFTVLALTMLVQQNLNTILTQWGRQVKVDVYLQDQATPAQTSEVQNTLRNSGMFSKVTYFSKAQAAERFKERVGHYMPGLLDDLDTDNPLPASFELEMKGGLSTHLEYQGLVKFADTLKKMAGVDDVSYGQGWVENYASVLHVFSLSTTVFVFVMLMGSLFVIGNSIRNSISQRSDEIELLELFGATSNMIIWPYIFEGLMLGFLAAVAALIVAYLLYTWQLSLITQNLSFWNLHSKIDFLNASRVLSAIFTGTAMGGVGSYLWVRKLTTGWAAAESVER